MKAKSKTLPGNRFTRMKVSAAIAAVLLVIVFTACQKDEDSFTESVVGLKSSTISSALRFTKDRKHSSDMKVLLLLKNE